MTWDAAKAARDAYDELWMYDSSDAIEAVIRHYLQAAYDAGRQSAQQHQRDLKSGDTQVLPSWSATAAPRPLTAVLTMCNAAEPGTVRDGIVRFSDGFTACFRYHSKNSIELYGWQDLPDSIDAEWWQAHADAIAKALGNLGQPAQTGRWKATGVKPMGPVHDWPDR